MRKTKLLQLSDLELDKEFKIEGTRFDRRRKLDDSQIKTMRKLYKEGETLNNLALLFNVTVSTVRYHCDDGFKDYTNGMRVFYAYNTRTDNKERYAYKRLIIENNLY